MFESAQSKVKRIGESGVTPQEEPVKKNLKAAFASQLQEQSLQFRKLQKDYLQRKSFEIVLMQRFEWKTEERSNIVLNSRR